MQQQAYDYIIAGAGCAGLSLLYRLLQEPSLSKKKILVIDQHTKAENDRTWCFWEKEKSVFEEIVYHQWQELSVKSTTVNLNFSIKPYTYKMIRGIDFYKFVLQKAAAYSNVSFVYERITTIENSNKDATVYTENNTYTAQFVFNSILFTKPTIHPYQYWLLQHFTGWLIETPHQVFNEDKATFMDFTVSQHEGTTFMYVLPVTKNKALVEYTLFTQNTLPKEAYKKALQQYIQDDLQIKEYTIEQEEFGIIPMTNYHFPAQSGNIINIGIAGGQAKGSSGYTFRFIQKHCNNIVQSLVLKQHPFVAKTWRQKKFHLYDSVLLHVLHHQKMNGSTVFSTLFAKNSPQKILQFLDNETNLLQDVGIMSSVPTTKFFPAAIKELMYTISR